MSARPVLRSAIYTRVSTEHGLEQEFNSLDNQREAAEAYIKSQAHEGWRCLPARFDDGGFSGGSLDRPALQALLSEIQARRIDVVVVYKVDRLTRSLADFAKLVELFDRYGVSFVSVTQAFNTTTSMGRLTLNILLSFAQFEREVTGERIRDKIRASKQKGIWMGGVVPLGYRVENRALHPVEEHAAVIRTIFTRYRELGTVAALKSSLDQSGIVIPQRTDGAGRVTGGGPFSRGHLYKILKSPIYVGRLTHKGRVHEGQHPGILDLATWDAVQEKLAANSHGHTRQRLESAHLLVSRIRTPDGSLIAPTHAQKGSRRYRYYITRTSPVLRIQAAAIETAVAGALRCAIAKAPESDAELVVTHLTQVIVHRDRLELQLTGEREPIELLWTPEPTRRGRDIIVPAQQLRRSVRPMKAEDRVRILKAIGMGRRWMDELITEKALSTDAIASRENLSERSVRMTLSLAQLAPSIVKTIIEGRLPRGIAIRDLSELPSSWAEQEATLGVS